MPLRDNDEWEYRSEGCETGRYYDSFTTLAAQLGGQGWELMHITERQTYFYDEHHNRLPVDSVHLRGYFKRRKPKLEAP